MELFLGFLPLMFVVLLAYVGDQYERVTQKSVVQALGSVILKMAPTKSLSSAVFTGSITGVGIALVLITMASLIGMLFGIPFWDTFAFWKNLV